MSHYDITQDENLKLVRVTARGGFSKAQGEEVITTARLLATKTGYDILYDFRDTVTRVAMIDWYKLPQQLVVLRTVATRNPKVAILYPAHSASDYQCYAGAATSAGLNVRIFQDEAEALAWLK